MVEYRYITLYNIIISYYIILYNNIYYNTTQYNINNII